MIQFSVLTRLSERALAFLVFGLSAVVVGLVVLLITTPQLVTLPVDVSVLPRFHAMLNGTATVLLLLGYVLVRNGRISAHQVAMGAAFTLSVVFLLSYVVYHSQAPVMHYGGEGWLRSLYFFVLITHVVLAPVILPLALYTLLRALRGELGRHRKIARWTLPLWLYVTVTGVVVYLMMSPYYVFP
ncbi:MAG: DUF420 domain-containing protein [Gemmatimonadota bacterium]